MWPKLWKKSLANTSRFKGYLSDIFKTHIKTPSAPSSAPLESTGEYIDFEKIINNLSVQSTAPLDIKVIWATFSPDGKYIR